MIAAKGRRRGWAALSFATHLFPDDKVGEAAGIGFSMSPSPSLPLSLERGTWLKEHLPPEKAFPVEQLMGLIEGELAPAGSQSVEADHDIDDSIEGPLAMVPGVIVEK